MLLAPHRQVRHSHRFIHYGTPALPAAAPLPRERFSPLALFDGPVAGLVGIEGGVVSGVINLEIIQR